MSLLEVSELSVGFHMRGRDVEVVRDVSFVVNDRETLAIVGESGSGKSQTAFSLLGLLAKNGYSRGSVRFEGKEIRGIDENSLNHIRAEKIAMIFQDPMTSLNPYLKVGEQLIEVLVEHRGVRRREAMARAVEMLQAVRLPDVRDIAERYPHQLSGGMRQRVSIAMALLCRPRILLADEPTTALDVTVQAQILDLFKALTAEFGTALVLITHDLGVVAGLADRVMVMYAGRVVEHGSVEDIFYTPRHPYTLGLLESTPGGEARPGALVTIPGLPPDLEAMPAGCPFHPRCRYRFDRCLEERPELEPVGPDHSKACFFEGELTRREPA